MFLAPPPHLFAYTGGKPFDAARPAIVFLHGAQHDHSVWILQSRYLAHHGFGVLALDLPGHGRSGGSAPATIEDAAAIVVNALAELSATRFLLAGHSMGSLIALEAANRMAGRVAGVALLATAFPMRVSQDLLQATREAPAVAMQMINVWSHSAGLAPFAAKPGNPGPGFNIVWENLRLMQRVAQTHGPDVLTADFAACNDYHRGLEAAAALACPALFILGGADQMTPPKAAQPLIKAIKQTTQVVTLANTGHAMMAENPEAVRNALRQFARQVFQMAGAG